MNGPVHHIGSTLHQCAVLRLHLEREHAAELERMERTNAALQVDALMSRLRQHDTCGCSVHDADEINDARWDLVIGLAVSMILTPAAYALAEWVLPIVWSWK